MVEHLRKWLANILKVLAIAPPFDLLVFDWVKNELLFIFLLLYMDVFNC